jgi:hypothetical protein
MSFNFLVLGTPFEKQPGCTLKKKKETTRGVSDIAWQRASFMSNLMSGSSFKTLGLTYSILISGTKFDDPAHP